jgi:glutathione S-transferase
MMTIRLHDYSASGNCYKVRLLLAQLGRDYERVPVDIFGGDTLTDDYGRLNPARQTPVLEIEGAEPLTESNAILVHLAEGTEYLPEDRNERAQALRWLFFEQAEVIPGIAGLRFRLGTGRIRPDGGEAAGRRWAGEAALTALNARLERHDFLAGARYSVADISLYAYVHVAHEAGYELSDYPAVERWLARVEATPGFMNDLAPYPPNARAGESRSIYD